MVGVASRATAVHWPAPQSSSWRPGSPVVGQLGAWESREFRSTGRVQGGSSTTVSADGTATEWSTPWRPPWTTSAAALDSTTLASSPLQVGRRRGSNSQHRQTPNAKPAASRCPPPGRPGASAVSSATVSSTRSQPARRHPRRRRIPTMSAISAGFVVVGGHGGVGVGIGGADRVRRLRGRRSRWSRWSLPLSPRAFSARLAGGLLQVDLPGAHGTNSTFDTLASSPTLRTEIRIRHARGACSAHRRWTS